MDKMTCYFYHLGGKKEEDDKIIDINPHCVAPYCYYPKSKEIDYPVKKEYIERIMQMKMLEARQQVRKD